VVPHAAGTHGSGAGACAGGVACICAMLLSESSQGGMGKRRVTALVRGVSGAHAPGTAVALAVSLRAGFEGRSKGKKKK